MQQLCLEFPISAKYEIEDYYVSEDNHKIIEFIKKWPNWGEEKYSKILILYGEEGCGKSHLVHIWQKISNAKFLSKETYSNPYSYIEKSFVLENIENLDQEMLMHLINVVEEKQQYLLMTSRVMPINLKFTLPDLSSRIRAIPFFTINTPSNELFKAVLYKHLSDRNLQVNMVAIDYIIPRIERSFTKLIRFVNKLEAASRISKKPITIPLIKAII